MIRLFNSPWLALVCLLGFLWLAWESRHPAEGYTESVFSVLDLRFRQAAALREVWGLTQADIDAPIAIWGTK